MGDMEHPAPSEDGLVGHASERQLQSGKFIYGAISTAAWDLHLPTGPPVLAERRPDNYSEPDYLVRTVHTTTHTPHRPLKR